MKLSYHQKSMLCSALVPGLGQIRNAHDAPNLQAVWKVPLIYGGLGAAGYFLISNQHTQLSLKQEYSNRLDGGSLNPTWAPYDDQAVLQLYRQYLDWRDLSILGFAAIYLFQIAEAGAAAHFVRAARKICRRALVRGVRQAKWTHALFKAVAARVSRGHDSHS
jgi:hypothetical protein